MKEKLRMFFHVREKALLMIKQIRNPSERNLYDADIIFVHDTDNVHNF